MGAITESDSSVRIGAPSHTGRYVGIAVAVVLLAGGVIGFQQFTSKQDAGKLQAFDTFRALYAEKCNAPAYAKAQPDVVRDDYLTSEPIQKAVAAQTKALGDGATCDDVVAALKTVDFKVPAPGPAQ